MSWLHKITRFFVRHSGPDFKYALEYLICLGEKNMATIQELKDAVANEAAEVKARLDELQANVQVLQDQIAAGGTITAADLDEVKAAIENIFVPTVV